jgi:nucleotide-binding universal stress UspA family protein
VERRARISSTAGLEADEWGWGSEPIVLPLAFDEREWSAAFLALYLAECTGAPVYVVHALVPGMRRDLSFFDFVREHAARLGVDLRLRQAELRSSNRREIAKLIAASARELDAQAIVMAGHKEGAMTRLLGRVSDTVAKLAECRVLIAESGTMVREKLERPRRVLVAYLKENLDPEPLIVAAAMTSSAWPASLEILAVRFVRVPETVPLDSDELSRALRRLERDFFQRISEATKSLGRVIVPKLQPVREPGEDIAVYARDNQVDLILLPWGRPGRLRALGRPDDVVLVNRAPCPVVLVFGAKERRLSQQAGGLALIQPWSLKS